MFSPQQDPKQIFDRIFGSTSSLLKGGLDKGIVAAESVYDNLKSNPMVRVGTEPVGLAGGAFGGAIGGLMGGVGNVVANAAEGRPLGENFGRDVMRTAKDTAGAGYSMGKGGAESYLMGKSGKVAGLALSAIPTAKGVKGLMDKDYSLDTGLNLGMGLAGMYGSAKSPNLTPGGVLDPQLKALASRVKDAVGVPGGMTMHKANYEMLAKAIRDADIPDTEKQGFLRSLYPNLKSDNQSFDSSRFDEAVNSGSLFRKSSASPKMSRGDYELVANSIKDAVQNKTITPENAWTIYEKMIPGLKQSNPNYNYSRFEKAAGLTDVLDEANASDPVLNPKTGEPIWAKDTPPKNYNKSPGQIVNSMDDGIDTSSNYGENLMNNDGGASPSVMKDANNWKAGAIKGTDGSLYPRQDPRPGDANYPSKYYNPEAVGAQPGKWTDAYSRPMDSQQYMDLENNPPFMKGMGKLPASREYLANPDLRLTSQPILTPAQQGVVTKLTKQAGALKGRIGADSVSGLSVPKNAAKAYSAYFGSKFSDSEIAQLFKDDPEGFIQAAKMGGVQKDALGVLEQMMKGKAK